MMDELWITVASRNPSDPQFRQCFEIAKHAVKFLASAIEDQNRIDSAAVGMRDALRRIADGEDDPRRLASSALEMTLTIPGKPKPENEHVES